MNFSNAEGIQVQDLKIVNDVLERVSETSSCRPSLFNGRLIFCLLVSVLPHRRQQMGHSYSEQEWRKGRERGRGWGKGREGWSRSRGADEREEVRGDVASEDPLYEIR